jgi:hypothetical protein
MITMVAGKPPQAGVAPLSTDSVHQGLEPSTLKRDSRLRGLSHLEGRTKAYIVPVPSTDICSVWANMGGGTFRRSLATKQRRTTLGWTSSLGGSHPREVTSGHSRFQGVMEQGGACQKAMCPSLTFVAIGQCRWQSDPSTSTPTWEGLAAKQAEEKAMAASRTVSGTRYVDTQEPRRKPSILIQAR